jgi:S-adenosylmethionine:tRNA ribosyltransferase-isomerase
VNVINEESKNMPAEDKMERFDYSFDKAQIAAAPVGRRDQSRLFVYHRKTGTRSHQLFSSLIDFLNPNDLLVVNNTRVFPARLFAKKRRNSAASGGGGRVELLLLKEKSPFCWEALVKGSVKEGTSLQLDGEGEARIVEDLGEGRKVISFTLPDPQNLYAYLEKWGEVPLPPYILQRRKEGGFSDQNDGRRYQTVYAKPIGSAAAPTAGLHFTKRLIAAIRKKGVCMATVTLRIGIDTFKPIGAERLTEHKMSGEFFEIPKKTAAAVQKTKASGGRVITVGTSATRAIESAADVNGTVLAMKGETELFIKPGYRFRSVDALITNFHPPRATGLVLVSAFLGYNALSQIYKEAVEERYRLFTYGDAMLIL